MRGSLQQLGTAEKFFQEAFSQAGMFDHHAGFSWIRQVSLRSLGTSFNQTSKKISQTAPGRQSNRKSFELDAEPASMLTGPTNQPVFLSKLSPNCLPDVSNDFNVLFAFFGDREQEVAGRATPSVSSELREKISRFAAGQSSESERAEVKKVLHEEPALIAMLVSDVEAIRQGTL